MRDETELDAHIGRQPRSRAIAALAARQYGVVSRAQLHALGLGRSAIDKRLRRGELHLLHRGIYAVGHPAITREAHWLAAVLAAGPHAVLSHRSAAALWGIRPSTRTTIDVATPRKLSHTHHLVLPPDEVTVVGAIPVTTAPRTILDLATVVGPRELERAIHEAEVRRLTDALSVQDLLARYPRRRGRQALRKALEAGGLLTRSDLEDRFLAFLDRHHLSRPRVNARVQAGGLWFEVDCVWADARVVVELDGFATHGTRHAFERDRTRDRALVAAGWRVVRITWRQLHDDPAALAAELRALGI